MREARDTEFPEWRFLQLTLFAAAWMLASPYLKSPWHVPVLMQALFLNSIIVTFWANPQWRNLRRAVVAFWLVALVGAFVVFLPLPPGWERGAKILQLASALPLIVVLAGGILMFVFRARHLSNDGIFATIMVYLLVALAFSHLYQMAMTADPTCFTLPAVAEGRTPPSLQNDMLYFSLVTLATVGYGDILPAGPSMRMLATLEAIAGQFYVAVVVAVFVSMHLRHGRD